MISIMIGSNIESCKTSLFREAWHKLGKMSKEEAMEKYVEVVCRVDPGWETTPLDPAAQQVHCIC